MTSRVSTARSGTRVPFADATSRANTVSTPQPPRSSSKYAPVHYNAVIDSPSSVGATYAYSPSVAESSPPPEEEPVASLAPPPAPPPHQTASAEARSRESDNDETKRYSAASRDSQASSDSKRYSSCDGFPNKKSHIGPWQLGKTLGKGSSARVRAARHSVTHQPVAVKIIAKKTARMTQSGSIAQLDEVDSSLPDSINGVRRMPLAIEREVAILKLIEHPNIVKLYDIWENRNEIYLIMEHVENGDLFTYVSCNGALTEESSLFVFRQMMNAVQYCHSYNICHRDLKPENILLKSDGQIKIADFGMAALHQGPRYHLQTSCGSPHYAAPELLKARPYRGEKADIWSMGVILFVMLAGRLPFDEDDLAYMLAKAKKGIYTMPAHFSPEAKDLVHRILQVEPCVRITMNEMWEHPLVWKYGYLDDYDRTRDGGRGAGGRDARMKPLDLATIDTQIFRQLHSMWHTLKDHELAGKLVSNEPNDQKMFYWLLHGFRERQMENFNPTLTHSMSDYHHVNQVLSKKVSTRQFSQSRSSGHKRSVSRFTVISNIAETEADTEYGTIRSYDPYKDAAPAEARASHAKIVIHRNNTNAEAEVRSIVQAETQRARAGSLTGRKRANSSQHRRTVASLHGSRASMNSIRSVRSLRSNGKYGTGGVRPAARYRRGVDFSRVRKGSISEQQPQYQTTNNVQPAAAEDSTTWGEDLSEFSCRIAKDLDNAFMSSLLTTDIVETDEDRHSPFSLRLSGPEAESPTMPCSDASAVSTDKAAVSGKPSATDARPWDSRPLPPSPPRSRSVEFEILQVETERVQRNKSVGARTSSRPMTANPAAGSSVPAVPPIPPTSERRVLSAPAQAPGSRGLPAINETHHDKAYYNEKEKPRAVSDPSKTTKSTKNQGLTDLAKAENTIRVVVSPSAPRTMKPFAVPQALDVPKNSSRAKAKAVAAPPAWDLSQSFPEGDRVDRGWGRLQDDLPRRQPTIPEEDPNDPATYETQVAPTRRSWIFRRQSKTEMRSTSGQSSTAAERPSSLSSNHSHSETSADTSGHSLQHALSARKSRLFPFWKSSRSHSSQSSGSEVAEADGDRTADRGVEVERRISIRSSKSKMDGKAKKRFSRMAVPAEWFEDEEEERSTRKIEPQQNWLAKVFRVKPAREHLCLSISQRRARQELVSLLREWRKYGIRDIEVDKVNNIVFARVSDKNYLNIREVSFACELMTVIEHRKTNQLCILRMTQEKGSANSFHKVTETIRSRFSDRCLLVADSRKAKMMIKTLNS